MDNKTANKIDEIRIEKLQAFANKHEIIFSKRGEVGFGRPCTGFLKGHGYIDYNPLNMENYEYIPEFQDDRLHPEAQDAYHKHNCFCVLVVGKSDPRTDDEWSEAYKQLLAWVQQYEAIGEVEVVDYLTGATGMQAAINGSVGYAIRFKDAAS